MNASSLSLLVGAVLCGALPFSASAADSDPGYGAGAPRVAAGPRSRHAPEYYRPTQHYYGKGFTVAYGFVPWSDRLARASGSFRSDRMNLPVSTANRFVSRSPRVTYYHNRSGTVTARRSTTTTIQIVTPLPEEDDEELAK